MRFSERRVGYTYRLKVVVFSVHRFLLFVGRSRVNFVIGYPWPIVCLSLFDT